MKSPQAVSVMVTIPMARPVIQVLVVGEEKSSPCEAAMVSFMAFDKLYIVGYFERCAEECKVIDGKF